jgi:hypothetical protein
MTCWGTSGGWHAPGSFDRPIEGIINAAASTTVSQSDCWMCSLASDGGVSCMARGDRDKECSGPASEPERMIDVPPLVGVSVGKEHACGYTASGEVWCWGSNSSGELGRPACSWAGAARVELDERVVGVAAGTSHTCALTAAGGVVCWGGSTAGELGFIDDVAVRFDGVRANRNEVCTWNRSVILCGAPPLQGFSQVQLTDVVDLEPREDGWVAVHSDGTTSSWRAGEHPRPGDALAPLEKKVSAANEAPPNTRPTLKIDTFPGAEYQLADDGTISWRPSSSRFFRSIIGIDRATHLAVAAEAACATKEEGGLSCVHLDGTLMPMTLVGPLAPLAIVVR